MIIIIDFFIKFNLRCTLIFRTNGFSLVNTNSKKYVFIIITVMLGEFSIHRARRTNNNIARGTF